MKKDSAILLSAVKYGLLMTLALMAFFLIMKLFGWHTITELRVLNFFILKGMLLLSIRNVKKVKGGVHANFLEGFGVGAMTSIVGVTAFAIFLAIYLLFLDPGFMTYLRENEAFGEYLNPVSAPFMIMIEGIGSGVILTFMIMQYLKNKVPA